MTAILSANDCKKIVENWLKINDFELLDYKIESLSGSLTGMMASYYTLTIRIKVNNETKTKKFFCKKMQMFHKVQEIMGRDQGAFEKEDYIYNYLIPECRKELHYQINYAPECYLAVKQDVFVFENLTDLGYKQPVIQRHDLDHIKVCLKVLAEFHASSILFEEHQSLKTGTTYSLFKENPDIFKDSLYRKQENYLGRHWFKNVTSTLAKLLDYVTPEKLTRDELKEKFAKHCERIYEIIQPSHTYKNVICHGDMSVVNIMFKYDEHNKPIDCKIVDYQALRYNPPAHDVMNYLYLAASRDFRKLHMNDLLEYYHRCLHTILEEHIENKDKHIVFEFFRESCEYIRPQALIQTACYSTMTPLYKNHSQILKDQKLYRRYIYEDRSSENIEFYKIDADFKRFVDELIHEFEEL